jgi:hypothetical protein
MVYAVLQMVITALSLFSALSMTDGRPASLTCTMCVIPAALVIRYDSFDSIHFTQVFVCCVDVVPDHILYCQLCGVF